MSRYIFSKNNKWYISEVFDPSDSKLQEKASYYTLTDDVTGPYYAVGTSNSAPIGVSYVPVVEPAAADVTLGVVDSQGRFQSLRFNGTQASNSGSAIQVQNYKTWDSTLPVPTPSGASMDFYKCSYVNSNSWGGYKAIQDSVTGIYSFESNSTEGLLYNAVTPVVGKIYSDNVLIEAKLWDGFPSAGLVFYAPLNESKAQAETGQPMIESGQITFGPIQGVPCASFAGSYIYGTAQLISGSSPFTVSLWLKSNTDQQVHWAFGTGSAATNQAALIGIRYSPYYGAMFYANDNQAGIIVNTSNWTHLVYIFDGSIMTTYVNGQYVIDSQYQFGTVNIQSGWKIAGVPWGTGELWDGYIAAVRVYNRELNQTQVTQLFNQFTPISAS